MDGGFRVNGGGALAALHAPQSPALLRVPAISQKEIPNLAQAAPAAGLVPAEGGGAGGGPGFAPLAWSGSDSLLRFAGIKGSQSPAPAADLENLLRAAVAREQLPPGSTAASPSGGATHSGLRTSACDDDAPSSRSANASAMLEKIMRQLHDIEAERDASVGNREGLPCSPEGSWYAMVGGVRLDISCGGKGNSNRNGANSGGNGSNGSGNGGMWCVDCGDGSLEVQLAAAVPTCQSALLSLEWQLRGHAPFARSGLFTLWGVDRSTRRTLTFAGQCRVCGGADTITGQWVISHEPRDCRDTHMFLNEYRDVFRRETLHMLRQKRLRELTVSGATTPAIRGSCDFFHSRDVALCGTTLNPVANIAKSSKEGILPKKATNVASRTLLSQTLQTPPPAKILFGSSPTIKPNTIVLKALELQE